MNAPWVSDPVFGFAKRGDIPSIHNLPKNRKQGLPPAFTLVEMLVTMTVSSTLLVLAAGMVHQTMRLQSQGRQQGARQQTALRLASQFRHDVQHGRQVSLQRDGAALTLDRKRPGEATVTYTAEDGQVLRVQLRADGRPQREPFCFALGEQAHFELLQDPRRAVLVVTRPAEHEGEKPRIELHVEAVVGRHRVVSSAEKGPAEKGPAEKGPAEKGPPVKPPSARTFPDKKYPEEETPS